MAADIGWLFGQPIGSGNSTQRTDSARTIARQPVGRISFAAQDSEGNPAIESAMFAGQRAVSEVLSFL